MPSKETVKKADDFIDVARRAEALRNGIVAAHVCTCLDGSKRPDDIVLGRPETYHLAKGVSRRSA